MSTETTRTTVGAVAESAQRALCTVAAESFAFCVASQWPERFVFVFGFGHKCQLSYSPLGFHPVRHSVIISQHRTRRVSK